MVGVGVRNAINTVSLCVFVLNRALDKREYLVIIRDNFC